MEKSKCIWIINQYVGSPLHGMEYRHYYLAEEMVKTGHKVVVISGSYSHLYSKLPLVSDKFSFENINGIEYCWVKVPPYGKSTSIKRIFNMLVFTWKLFSLPQKKMSKPDAVYVSSPSLFPILFASRIAKKYKAKLLFEVRDIWPLTLQELGNLSSKHPLIFFLQWFENYAYRKADKVISVLPGAKEHMVQHGMNPQKFVCIPNGIATSDTNVNKSAAQTILNKIPPGKFVVGYTGSMGVSNALDYFMQAARELKINSEILFVLVGKGEEKQNLREYAKDLNNVLFFDAVPKDAVQLIIERFDVCYIGWKKEALYRFGISANKIFEYMYSGKPVLHAVSAFNDPVADARCGISVEAENVKEIVNAVKKLSVMSSEQLNSLGKNGREFVIKNHSYQALAAKVVELI